MNIQFSLPTNTPRWKFWYEVIWAVGVVSIGIYGYLRWWRLKSVLSFDESLIELFICMLLLIGMLGAKWRFYQFKTLKMFLITIGGVGFIVALVLRAMNIFGSSTLATITEVYALSMLLVLIHKG